MARYIHGSRPIHCNGLGRVRIIVRPVVPGHPALVPLGVVLHRGKIVPCPIPFGLACHIHPALLVHGYRSGAIRAIARPVVPAHPHLRAVRGVVLHRGVVRIVPPGGTSRHDHVAVRGHDDCSRAVPNRFLISGHPFLCIRGSVVVVLDGRIISLRAAPMGTSRHVHVARLVHRNGGPPVRSMARAVVPGHPELCAVRGVVLHRGVIVVSYTALGIPCHVHVARPVHGYGNRTVRAVAGPVVPVHPLLSAAGIVFYGGIVRTCTDAMGPSGHGHAALRVHGNGQGQLILIGRPVVPGHPELRALRGVLHRGEIHLRADPRGPSGHDHVALRVHGNRLGHIRPVRRPVIPPDPGLLKDPALTALRSLAAPLRHRIARIARVGAGALVASGLLLAPLLAGAKQTIVARVARGQTLVEFLDAFLHAVAEETIIRTGGRARLAVKVGIADLGAVTVLFIVAKLIGRPVLASMPTDLLVAEVQSAVDLVVRAWVATAHTLVQAFVTRLNAGAELTVVRAGFDNVYALPALADTRSGAPQVVIIAGAPAVRRPVGLGRRMADLTRVGRIDRPPGPADLVDHAPIFTGDAVVFALVADLGREAGIAAAHALVVELVARLNSGAKKNVVQAALLRSHLMYTLIILFIAGFGTVAPEAVVRARVARVG